MEEYAAECRRRAAASADPYLRKIFDDLAWQWEELAALQRRLQADRRRKRLPG